MTESSSANDLQCTDILMHLAGSEASQYVMDSDAIAVGSAAADDLTSIKALLSETERALRSKQHQVQDLQDQLQQQLTSSPAAKKSEANPFDMMLTLSSEREAALRERKLYKDRAANAEENIAQLESDLAAAHATAKLQAERANKLAARHEELQRCMAALDSEKLTQAQRITELEAQLSARSDAGNGDDAAATLRRLLQERDKKILELERLVTDHAGAPTMFGGEIERLAASALPAVIYALESLDTPGTLHKLTRSINTIGRSKNNDIAIESPSISRFHARLLNKPDGVWLVDLQSINGCHVNERRISSQLLSEGDLVVIGGCRFRFSTMPRQSAPLLPSDQAAPSP